MGYRAQGSSRQVRKRAQRRQKQDFDFPPWRSNARRKQSHEPQHEQEDLSLCQPKQGWGAANQPVTQPVKYIGGQDAAPRGAAFVWNMLQIRDIKHVRHVRYVRVAPDPPIVRVVCIVRIVCMTLDDFNKKKSKIPDAPGAYFFLGPRKEILYIGKAASLRDRVRSYFSPDLITGRGERLVHMVHLAKSIDFRQTDSVLEALIYESNLIKTHKPEYNTLAKDDKSYNYVVITKEDFPRVLLMRGKELHVPGLPLLKATFGPFPHGMQLRIAMKIIRRIFPYRDEKCVPCAKQGSARSRLNTRALQGDTFPLAGCRPCFNRQIGLCPGVCTGEVTREEYARTIRHIRLFFDGKKKTLMRELEREMKRAAREERFEDAGRYKRQMFALQHIQDVALIRDEYRVPSRVMSDAFDPASEQFVPHGIRIEAYDIAHMRGAAAYGVMTVVENNEAIKSEYRLFRIRAAAAGDDPGALREVLSRRLPHDEWPAPRFIVVDGGTAQMNTAEKLLSEHGMAIPVVGVVKDEKHRPREIRLGTHANRELVNLHERDIILANSEAHRFAITRHRKTMRSKLTTND